MKIFIFLFYSWTESFGWFHRSPLVSNTELLSIEIFVILIPDIYPGCSASYLFDVFIFQSWRMIHPHNLKNLFGLEYARKNEQQQVIYN